MSGATTLWSNAATIRAAVADVLDEGVACAAPQCSIKKHGWNFRLLESDSETSQRAAFMDAVVARIVTLQASLPRDHPTLSDLCVRHQHRRLAAPASNLCGDCERERKR